MPFADKRHAARAAHLLEKAARELQAMALGEKPAHKSHRLDAICRIVDATTRLADLAKARDTQGD